MEFSPPGLNFSYVIYILACNISITHKWSISLGPFPMASTEVSIHCSIYTLCILVFFALDIRTSVNEIRG